MHACRHACRCQVGVPHTRAPRSTTGQSPILHTHTHNGCLDIRLCTRPATSLCTVTHSIPMCARISQVQVKAHGCKHACRRVHTRACRHAYAICMLGHVCIRMSLFGAAASNQKCMSMHMSMYRSMHMSMFRSMHMSVHMSMHMSIDTSLHMSMHKPYRVQQR